MARLFKLKLNTLRVSDGIEVIPPHTSSLTARTHVLRWTTPYCFSLTKRFHRFKRFFLSLSTLNKHKELSALLLKIWNLSHLPLLLSTNLEEALRFASSKPQALETTVRTQCKISPSPLAVSLSPKKSESRSLMPMFPSLETPSKSS